MVESNLEFERQKRVINMMLTAHSVMSDHYRNISNIFNISLLVVSIFLNALVFVSDNFFRSFGLNAEFAKLFLGIISVILLMLSVLGIMLNSKQKSENHSQAFTQFFYLLNETRDIEEIQDEAEKIMRIKLFALKYSQISGTLVPIPDKKFNRLKSIHLRKVEFSKFITNHPSKPYIIQKYLFLKHSMSEN